MADTIQKTFRIPKDMARELEAKGNQTEYVVAALREKLFQDEVERFKASARRIAQLPVEERDVEYAVAAQAEVASEA